MFVRSAAIAMAATAVTAAAARSAGRPKRRGSCFLSSLTGDVMTIHLAAWLAYQVSDILVTANTVRSIGPTCRRMVDRRGDLIVTVSACVRRHLAIPVRDAQGVGIPAGREVERMPEPVSCFDRVFAYRIVRRVAVVARRDRAVRGLVPRVEVFTHDVAIRARARVVGQVGVPPGVTKRKCAQTDREPRRDGHQHGHARHQCRTCHPSVGGQSSTVGSVRSGCANARARARASARLNVRHILWTKPNAPSANIRPPVAVTGALFAPTCGARTNPVTIPASPTFASHQCATASPRLYRAWPKSRGNS